MRLTGLHHIFTDQVAADSPATVIFRVGHGSSLVLLHGISGTPLNTGGKCAVAFCTDAAGTVAIDSGSAALPASAVTAGYAAILTPVTEWVKVTLTITDGTHNVWAESHSR